ncbi:MAG TPA: hypothetical protein VHD60_04280 [Candidatus Saccharimonadales bacterium]|nr:hypothetical protein [Candidatus Saccharimonadales bacterium]
MKEKGDQSGKSDTPAGAYIQALGASIDRHNQRERLKGSAFERTSSTSSDPQGHDALLREIGRVADLADPVPAPVVQAARKTFPDDLDASYRIPDELLFLPPDQQFRLNP